MKNYIGLNIKYLCDNNLLSQDEFGDKFGLKKSVIGTYVREISQPKIETIQKICLEFGITIDDFINRPLNEQQKLPAVQTVNDASAEYLSNSKVIELLENSLNDKQKLIESLERELENFRASSGESKAG